MKGLQRFISGMLAVCLLISMLPVGAWATETEPAVETVPETTVWETQDAITVPTEPEVSAETTTESENIEETIAETEDGTLPAPTEETQPSTTETTSAETEETIIPTEETLESETTPETLEATEEVESLTSDSVKSDYYTNMRQLSCVVRTFSNGYTDTYDFVYSADGLPIEISFTQEQGNYTYEDKQTMVYDSYGRLIEVWQPMIEWITWPVASYTYNDAGQLISSTYTEGSTSETTYIYDGSGCLVQSITQYDTGTETRTYHYDEHGQLTDVQIKGSYEDGSITNGSYTYEFDEQQRLIEANGILNGESTQHIYEYDRLPFVCHTGSSSNLATTSTELLLQDVEDQSIWQLGGIINPRYTVNEEGYLTNISEDGYDGAGSTITFTYEDMEEEDSDLIGWRQAYYENIEAYRSAHEDWGTWDESVIYEPIYIDNDDIPELFIVFENYSGFSYGHALLRYTNEGVVGSDSFGNGSLEYIERGGLYRLSWNVNGYENEAVCSLDNGKVINLGGFADVGYDNTSIIEYTWGDATVSQAEYQEKVNELFPQDQVKHTGSDNSKTYDYDGILEWLLNPETYQLVCTPEEPVVQTGQKLEIVVSLYCNDQLVKDWEPMGYSTGNLKYKNGRKADDGYHIILEADKIGDAHVTVNYTDAISLTIPVTVVSDVEESDILRKEWIREHINYAAGAAYEIEIIAGYNGDINSVFTDTMNDIGIQVYDLTECISNLKTNPSQADLYGILLADILLNSLEEDFLQESYVNNLNKAMSDFAIAVATGATGILGTTDAANEAINALEEVAKVLNQAKPGTDAFSKAIGDFFSITETHFTNGDFANSAAKGGLLTGIGIYLDGIDIYNSSQKEIFIYTCNSMAYRATSSDFIRVLDAMEQKIYREFAEGDFPGIGKYDDAMNWNDLASSISTFRKELDRLKEDRSKAVAEYALKTEHEAVGLFLENTAIAIGKYAVLTLVGCIPGINVISSAYQIIEGANIVIEFYTTADEGSYCLDMVTKLYCLSVLLDSIADDFAEKMDHDYFWISSAFDETITMYKGVQSLAAKYLIDYKFTQLHAAYWDLKNWDNNIMDSWFIDLRVQSLEAFISDHKQTISALQTQQSYIDNLLCHSPLLHYNSVTNEIQRIYLDSNIFIIACPTAVQILDENGNQIAYLSNDTCQVENGHELYYRTIPLSDTESMKIAVVPDSYKMVVSGTAEGEMDVFAAEFKEDIDTVSTYLNVPINVDSEIILEPDKDNPEVIHLTVDDTPCEPFTVNTIAQGTCGENLNWALYEEGILSITGSGEMYDFERDEIPWYGYRDQITEILLPDGLTRIGDDAFRGLYNVQSVTIPEGVTEIGSCAFIMTGLTSVSLPESLRIIDVAAFSSTSLKTVAIPDSVTHIGGYAFSECDLNHIFIPASVTEIGGGAFSNCPNLTSISVDPGNPNFVTDEHGVLYSSDMTTLYQCPGAYSGEYVIPYGVTTLDSCAFEGCAGLTKVTIPNSVTSLPGQSTFAHCQSLTELILPDGITSLGYGFAFYDTNLKTVSLPEQLKYMGYHSFYRCSNLTRIIIPESVIEISRECFIGAALQTIIFRGSAPAIDETAFTGITATAYYPGNDPSWTTDTMLDYGGNITWVPVYENETVTHIDAKKTILNAGETLDLTAVLEPGVLVDEEIIWTLYDDGNGGGTELITENGTTAQLYAGYYLYDNVITVTAQAADSSAEPAVLEITIRERDADYTLFAGKSVTLKETDPATGKPYASKRLQWYMSTENEPYATLTSAGKLTAKKVVSKNRIIVYADIDGKPGFMRVVDIYPAVTQVDVMWEDNNPINGKTIPVDFTTQNLLFTVTAHPLDTMQNVTWSISDSEKQTYAEYETNGRVLRVFNLKRTKAGTVTVKATVDAGQKKSTTFKLQFGSFAKEVQITAAADYLQSGNSLQLSAVTVPAKPTKSGITWSLSQEDKAYASISSSGLLKAKTVYGRTEITVIATSKDGQAQAEFPVTILPANSAILLLKCGEENVTKRTVYVDLNGDPSITLTAERFDKLAQPSVTWTVPKSAEVLEKTDTSLTLRFLKAGTATITATGADKQKATVKVVAAKMAQSVEISQKKTNLTEGFEVASGKTLELKATVENAKNKKVTWSLAPGDKDFAKISSSGKLTASKNLTTMRQVTVTATAADGSGISDVAVVTIRPIAQGVQIYSVVDGVRTFSVRSDPSRWVRSNTVYEWDMVASTRLTLSSHVYPYYAENHPRNAMQGVTWKSSSPKIVSVDANGNVICHKPGSTTITATAKDGSSKKVTFKLTVVKKTTGLQLPDQQVIGGKTLALNKLVQYSPTDVTNKTLKWEIIGGTGTDYATLSSKGSLKTKKVTKPVTVTVRITATDGTHCTDTCTVTILPKS